MRTFQLMLILPAQATRPIVGSLVPQCLSDSPFLYLNRCPFILGLLISYLRSCYSLFVAYSSLDFPLQDNIVTIVSLWKTHSGANGGFLFLSFKPLQVRFHLTGSNRSLSSSWVLYPSLNHSLSKRPLTHASCIHTLCAYLNIRFHSQTSFSVRQMETVIQYEASSFTPTHHHFYLYQNLLVPQVRTLG